MRNDMETVNMRPVRGQISAPGVPHYGNDLCIPTDDVNILPHPFTDECFPPQTCESNPAA